MKPIINYWTFYLLLVVLFIASLLIPIILPVWAVLLAGYLMLTAGKPLFKQPTTADFILSPIFILIGLVITIGLVANSFLKVGFITMIILSILTALGSQLSHIIDMVMPKKKVKKQFGTIVVERTVDFGDLFAGLIIIFLSWLIVGGTSGLIVGTVLSFIMALIPKFKGALFSVRAVIIFIIVFFIKYIAGFLGGLFG